MIPVAESDPPAPSLSVCDTIARSIPHAYSILFFSENARLGWWLMAISMLAPDLGLAGLAGVCAAGALAWWLGYDHTGIRTGFLLFNPLLACLAVGWLNRSCHFAPGTYVALWSVAVAGTLFLSVSMQHWFGAQFGISAHSLPAMLAGYGLYLIASPVSHSAEAAAWLEPVWVPPLLRSMFQAFGAMLFQPNAVAGALVFIGLALTSTLSTLLASAAFAVGVATLARLGVPFSPERLAGSGFNFVLTGIGLGAGYFITSGPSVVLALAGAVLCAFTSLVLERIFALYHIPPSALAYNLVVPVVVYALRLRWLARGLQPSPSPGSLPESAVRHVLIEARRFPHLKTPALFLPCDGPRVITQAFAGALTHRGPWRHALDFEMEKLGDKHAGAGTELTDYFTFDTPVYSPCAGVVEHLVNHVADNIPGQNNPDANWGNYALIRSDAGCHVMLAHLRCGSSAVVIGQRVWPGTVIGACGNSGRSPIPHLHVHVQASGILGAPTIPFCLKHYIEVTGDGPLYKTSGVPLANSIVRPATPNAALGEMLYGWLPGEYRYRVSADGGAAWEETVLLDFDEAGRFRLRSHRRHARLTAFLSEGVLYCTDYEGTARSVLAYIAAGLARVPCIGDADATWSDDVGATPFLPGMSRWMLDLSEPFFGVHLLGFTYRMEATVGGFIVRAIADDGTQTPPPNAPREITTTLIGRRGVRRLEVRLFNERVLRAELLDQQVDQ